MELLGCKNTLTKEVAKDSITSYVSDLLEQIQRSCLKNIGLQKYAYYEVNSFDETVLETKGGFVSAIGMELQLQKKRSRPNESDH
jgi:hypothetical protein